MKKLYAYFFILFFASNIQAQNKIPENLCLELNQALIQRDSVKLSKLLDNNCSYGHSNLWIEDKKHLIQNNQSKYLIYREITCDSIQAIYTKKICVVRYQGIFKVSMDSKNIDLKLHVMQVWHKRGKHWKLLARQSVKMP